MKRKTETDMDAPYALANGAAPAGGFTLLEVMIAVGGLAEYAAGNRAAIVRQDNGQQLRIPVRLTDLLNDGDISANMQMRPGDVLIIPESRF